MKQRASHRPTGTGPVPRRTGLKALTAAWAALLIVSAGLIPSATAVADELAPSDYRIGGEDVLEIRIYGEPELTSIARVQTNGTIALPLIGDVEAAGLTIDTLRTRITERFQKGYLKNPQIMIFLQQYRQSMVHLFGEVSAPGPYRLTHQDTLMELISKAGGFTPVAKKSKVKIIRQAGGTEEIVLVDTTEITDKGKIDRDVALMPDDIIIVPERFF